MGNYGPGHGCPWDEILECIEGGAEPVPFPCESMNAKKKTGMNLKTGDSAQGVTFHCCAVDERVYCKEPR